MSDPTEVRRNKFITYFFFTLYFTLHYACVKKYCKFLLPNIPKLKLSVVLKLFYQNAKYPIVNLSHQFCCNCLLMVQNWGETS